MSAGYLIRDEAGQVVGYALEGEEQILVRMHGGEGAACVAAYSAGQEVFYEVPCDRQEHAFEWTMGRIDHIAIRRCTEKKINEKEESNVQTEEDKKDKKDKKEKENKQAACKKQTRRTVYRGRRIMERSARMTRWPPPPCWPTAHYVGGIWEEGGD